MKALEAKINRIAEFKDKNLERTFFTQYITEVKHTVERSALIIGACFLLMTFFNIFIMGLDDIWVDVFARSFIFVFSIIVFFFVRNSNNPHHIANLFIVYLSLVLIIYQWLLIINNDTTLMDRALAFTVIMFSSFLIPTRWIYNVLFAIGMSVMFTVCTVAFSTTDTNYQLPGILVYFIITFIVGSLFCHNLYIYRRIQFLREIELKIQSTTDPLTQAYNRQMLDSRLKEQITWASSHLGAEFSIILFDLDDFKRINDTYGHLAGDKVLVGCADIVRDCLRKEDIFARWGGEEFVILFSNTPASQVKEIAERIRYRIENGFKNEEYQVTASFGVTQFKSGDSSETIVSRADQCMYQAKQKGKNNVMVC